MAPVEKESASGARSAAGSGSGSGSGEGRTFQYSRHLAVVAVGCLLLLARDFLNTKDGSQSGKAPVPTQSPNTVATTTASSGASGADAVVVNNNLDVPESQMKFLDTSSGKSAQRLFMEENSVGHRVHISYCQSCSYKGMAAQCRQIFLQEHPDLEFTFSNYPISKLNEVLGEVTTYLLWTVWLGAWFGKGLCERFNYPVPALLESIQDKKMLVCLGAWFLAGVVTQNLRSTGALEIYYNSMPIFSKLEQRRIPNVAELTETLNLLIKQSRGAAASA